MNLCSFTLQGDLATDELRQLFSAVSLIAPFALLVQRPDRGLSESGNLAVARLEPFLVLEESRSEWPGTTLLDAKACVRIYRNEPGFRAVVLELSNGLFSWRQPNAPEDLCFLRHDHRAVFTTISHERDAFFELTPEEHNLLIRHMPALADRLQRDFVPDERVRVKANAPPHARPASLAQIIDFRGVESDDDEAIEGRVAPGTRLYTIELEDGSSMELEGSWLEPVDS